MEIRGAGDGEFQPALLNVLEIKNRFKNPGEVHLIFHPLMAVVFLVDPEQMRRAGIPFNNGNVLFPV